MILAKNLAATAGRMVAFLYATASWFLGGAAFSRTWRPEALQRDAKLRPAADEFARLPNH